MRTPIEIEQSEERMRANEDTHRNLSLSKNLVGVPVRRPGSAVGVPVRRRFGEERSALTATQLSQRLLPRRGERRSLPGPLWRPQVTGDIRLFIDKPFDGLAIGSASG